MFKRLDRPVIDGKPTAVVFKRNGRMECCVIRLIGKSVEVRGDDYSWHTASCEIHDAVRDPHSVFICEV